MVKWSYILAGAAAGGAIGYGAAYAYCRWKDRQPLEDDEMACDILVEEDDLECDAIPPEMVEEYGDTETESENAFLRVSKTGAGKWASANGKEIEEVLYFPKDEVLGGYDVGAFGQKTFVVVDLEDLLASFIEDRRLIPNLSDAFYIYEGQCYHVKADEEHEFAEMFDTLNQDIPAYPEE